MTEGSDGWMDGWMEEEGHKIEFCLVLLNSLKIGIHAKRGPLSRQSHSNWPCNSHSSHASSFTGHPQHMWSPEAERNTQRRDHHLGIHVMLMALSFTSCRCLLMNPINKQTGLCHLVSRLTGRQTSGDRQTCVQTDRETKWTRRQQHHTLAGGLIKWMQRIR